MKISEGDFVLIKDFLRFDTLCGDVLFEVGAKKDIIDGWDQWWLKNGYSGMWPCSKRVEMIYVYGGIWRSERDFDAIYSRETVFKALLEYLV